MVITQEQLIELIDFSPSLDFEAKIRWRSYLPYLKADESERLYRFLVEEKQAVTDLLQQKLKGVRGYFFAKNLETFEQDFIRKNT